MSTMHGRVRFVKVNGVVSTSLLTSEGYSGPAGCPMNHTDSRERQGYKTTISIRRNVRKVANESRLGILTVTEIRHLCIFSVRNHLFLNYNRIRRIPGYSHYNY